MLLQGRIFTKFFHMIKKTTIGITAFNLVLLGSMLYVLNRKKSQTQSPTIVKEVKYVFFSTEGKPITLSEQDVYNVRQKYEDGVLPTDIAEQYNMTAVMVCRIINSIKNL